MPTITFYTITYKGKKYSCASTIHSKKNLAHALKISKIDIEIGADSKLPSWPPDNYKKQFIAFRVSKTRRQKGKQNDRQAIFRISARCGWGGSFWGGPRVHCNKK